jgi:hypothetical protein
MKKIKKVAKAKATGKNISPAKTAIKPSIVRGTAKIVPATQPDTRAK